MTNVIIGEFVGTILLVLLGDGVCAQRYTEQFWI